MAPGGNTQRRGAHDSGRVVARKLIGTTRSVLSFTSVGTIDEALHSRETTCTTSPVRSAHMDEYLYRSLTANLVRTGNGWERRDVEKNGLCSSCDHTQPSVNQSPELSAKKSEAQAGRLGKMAPTKIQWETCATAPWCISSSRRLPGRREDSFPEKVIMKKEVRDSN